jgi:diguanylate cyclase (GGDEF)-like protein
MQTSEQIAKSTIELLASKELVRVSAALATIVQTISESQFAAVVMWDPDLDMLSDRFVFGPTNRGIDAFLGSFCDEFRGEEVESNYFELKSTSFSIAVPAELEPLYCLQLSHEDRLCACILFTAQKREPQAIVTELNQYPASGALAHSWELRELQSENDRLRKSYEELEDKIALLEEQTHKLIHDLTTNDSMRTKHVKRERLVYSISNVVRSSVDIHKVLETTVEQIGTTFGVSRCILLRTNDFTPEGMSVYEYVRSVPSVRELFLTEDGLTFARTALNTKQPHDLIEHEFAMQKEYEPNFLKTLGMRSGLVVPLMMRERILGALFLQDCIELRPWNIDDISLIGSLADQISVAIENAELHQEKEKQAVTDGLTGIANRRHFNEVFSREFERAKRYNHTLSLVMLDLDFLKVINDTFGHQVGDEAIREIGRLLKQSSRAVDLPARYGGEEFCLLLPNTEITMAEQLAERLRRLINDVHIEGPGHISASFGVANYPLHAGDPDILFRRADEALYEAKQAGRNMVKVASEIQELKVDKPARKAKNGTAQEHKASRVLDSETPSGKGAIKK